MKRPLLYLALLALALRASLAVVTEFKPLFPAYYYTDSTLMDQAGWRVAEAWREGRPPAWPGSPSQRVQAASLAVLYRLFGHHLIVPKLLNACAGAAIVLVYFAAVAPIFGALPALGSAALIAVWPSHIFFTSQNFKDAFVILLCFAGFLQALVLMAPEPRRRPALHSALLLVFLLALSLLRPYTFLLTAGVLAAALTLAWARSRPRWPALSGLAAVLLAAALSPWLARAVFLHGPLAMPAGTVDPSVHLALIQNFDPASGRSSVPTTAADLSDLRRRRQDSDRQWARTNSGRDIGTQLFYGLAFQSWLDVLLFLPKGIFYVLFMPLPLLYPVGHNAGRILASLENCLVLALALAAGWGVWRGPKTIERFALLLFTFAASIGTALLEFDLGSATRHRLLHMPLLFPFALSLVFPCRPRRRSGGRLRVLQVLECGGPGGTGNQVASICNDLDAARFEVGLVYSVRPGQDPESYRKLCAGAENAVLIPELVREISPLDDLKALWKLRRLFLEQAPDIVHAHSSKAGVLARLAAGLAGVPKIFYSPHGYAFLQQDRAPWVRALYKAVEWSVSWIGTIVAVSPSEAALARPLAWGQPVETISDAYLGDGAPALEPHDGLRFGGCGRMTHARNLEAFVNLCQRLTDSRNGLRCTWIGGGEDEPSVRRHLENMNLMAKVELTGWLEGGQALRRMGGLDVFVHYSRWDGLPNVVLEAMALGLPVVASDIPGNRDAVVHGETGFLARNEVELLEFCLKLADDPQLRRRLGEAGRARVQREFDRQRARASLQELYQK